ncbi:MAG: GGDEF domain-containing phosphodiesterase [Roseburia sp.]|nr:GGDEF domain-containing phosphodiesterase [Roseburia sp.]MCM1279348.1 GGDEF domain-containing phosphodiesterase [Robinsoniella sp.]
MFHVRKRRSRDHFLGRMIAIGLVALIICTIICILHVVDVKKNFEEERTQNIEKHLMVSTENMSEHMNHSMETLEQAVSVMTRSGKKPDKELIFFVLGEYQNINDFSLVVFIDNNGTTYYADGGTKQKGEEPIEMLYVTEKRIMVFNNYDLGDGVGTAMYVMPVIFEGEKLGEMVGLQPMTDMLKGYAFEYLNEIGDTFLIGMDGEILVSQSREFDIKPEAEENIFDLLKGLDLKGTDDVEAIDSMQKDLNNHTTSRIILSTGRGAVYAASQQIEGVEKFYLFHCYRETVFNERVYPVLYRSVASVLIIVTAMLCLLIYVWFCLRRNINIIEKLAYEDPITKGKNLNYFTEKASRIISEGKRTNFAVARFDILNFRYINEAYGHSKADDLLTIISMEGNKVFQDKELCIRMTADHFVVLLKSKDDYKTKIQEFIDNINIRAIESGIIYPIKLKCGIYQIRNDDRDIDQILDRANAARKSLVGNEKELISFYSDKIINDMRMADKIESDMDKALMNREFKLFLQPKWNIEKDELYGAEALVRWIKPDGTVVYPDQFIPVFESNGFIEKLDFYMLTNVCRMLHNLQRAGMPVFPVSVNQSRRLWDNPGYVEHVGQILKRYQVPSNMVELEVTETVFFEERDKMLAIIHALKEKEVLLSMDDFGSGYSSLNLLKDVPFDVLKIDREFFSESVTSQSSTWILQKIIEMAEGLNIRVLCEGVETKEQVELLGKLGCKYVQGYYYSEPLSMAAFLERYFGDHIELSDDDGEDTTTE